MKFLAVVLAVFFAATDASPSVKTQRLSGTSIRGGLDTRKLMEKAVKVDRQGRRILSSTYFQVTSDYSVQFDTCVSLKTEPSENQAIIFDDALIKYTKQGDIIPQESYILFNVCETKYCGYYAKDDNLFMIDLASYMYSFSAYYLQRQEVYCAACEDSISYCE